MTAQILKLVIPSKRQDDLAHEINLQRLSRQNQEASWRKEVLECIAKAETTIAEAEAVIMHHEQVIFYGRELLRQMDEKGPHDAA